MIRNFKLYLILVLFLAVICACGGGVASNSDPDPDDNNPPSSNQDYPTGKQDFTKEDGE